MPKNVSDWHRQQRKKELQKNKAARIANRDEKVKSEKTEQMVLEEIQKLEKQHKNVETRPHAIQSKIDRLKKELKIVKEENNKAGLAKSKQPPSNVFQPLARPELSVYYDATLNPFGEPPPGRPRLFHRRDGGVTMHLEEAGLPGEPPPPPPKREGVTSRQSQPAKQSVPEKKRNVSKQLPKEGSKEANESTTTTINKKIDPSCIPALPKPSAAVIRSKRKLQVDIWASNEEVEYEDATGTGVEGVVTTADTWWYLDASSQIQGPFQLNQMKQWIQAGFFPSATKVRSSEEEPWKKIGKHPVFKSFLPESMHQTSNNQNEMDNRLNQQSSVENRIAALRRERESQQIDSLGKQAISENTGGSDSPIQSRKSSLPVEQESSGDLVDEQVSEDENSVQNRIAALRAESLQKEVAGEDSAEENERSVQNRIAALRAERLQKEVAGEDSAEESERSVQGRIAALRTAYRHDDADEQNALPVENVEESIENEEEQQPMYPIHDNAEPPSSRLTDEMNDFNPPPAFPLDDYSSYPTVVDETDAVPPTYPVDELDQVVSRYPVDMDYPAVGEYPVSETYPNASSYPIDEDTAVQIEEPVQLESPSNMERPKKIIKVDKELVALMPSHLQKRRPVKTKR